MRTPTMTPATTESPTATTSAAPRRRRNPLNRDRICQAGLAYIDGHGLEALSLHKLAETLDVRAMSLYNHIGGKDDLLAGIVECLWRQIEQRASPGRGWKADLEHTVRTVRTVIRAHPAAAPLLVTQPVFPVPALRAVESVLGVLRAAGFTEQRAVDVVRLLVSYAIGSTLSEICWTSCGGATSMDDARDERQRIRHIARTLPPDVPDSLFDLALKICGECDPAGMFDLGLELMLRGLEPDHNEQPR